MVVRIRRSAPSHAGIASADVRDAVEAVPRADQDLRAQIMLQEGYRTRTTFARLPRGYCSSFM